MSTQKAPHTIFIIPYRDRVNQRRQFISYFNDYIQKQDDLDGIKYYFIHQCDKRPFNRGAMKNIGILFFKNKFPQEWENITFILHDIDCYPSPRISLPYKTTRGTVAHYYGTTNTLGGIVAIKGHDFMKIGGFPNFWGWGYEDNMLYQRCIHAGLMVDRTTFYPLTDIGHIIRLDIDDNIKSVSISEMKRFAYNSADSVNSISNISSNQCDNMINILNFTVPYNPGKMVAYNTIDGVNRPDKYVSRRGVRKSGRQWDLLE